MTIVVSWLVIFLHHLVLNSNPRTSMEVSSTLNNNYSLPEPRSKESCPMKKTATRGQKILKKYKKVKKWEDCAQKCQENKKCQAWTYRPRMKNQKQPQKCTIMSRYKSFSKDKFFKMPSYMCPNVEKYTMWSHKEITF